MLYRVGTVLSCVPLTYHIKTLRGQKAEYCAFGVGGTQYQLKIKKFKFAYTYKVDQQNEV